MTGWFNFLGQAAVTTGIDYGLAVLIATLAAVHGFVPTVPKQVGIHAGLLISQGIVNTFGIKTLAWFNRSSVLLQSVGIGSLCIALLAKAPTH